MFVSTWSTGEAFDQEGIDVFHTRLSSLDQITGGSARGYRPVPSSRKPLVTATDAVWQPVWPTAKMISAR
jgi:hypothetical protein